MSPASGHRLSLSTRRSQRPSEVGHSPQFLIALVVGLCLRAPQCGASVQYAAFSADLPRFELTQARPSVGLAWASSTDTTAVAAAPAPAGERSIEHARSLVMILLRWVFVASVALLALAMAGTFGLVPTWRGRAGSPVD